VTQKTQFRTISHKMPVNNNVKHLTSLRCCTEYKESKLLAASIGQCGNCTVDATSNVSLILVVDDESDVEMLFRQQFRRDLRDNRFMMDFARSADSACNASATPQTHWILILSDINMPGMRPGTPAQGESRTSGRSR
jgi:hypothetical protein